MQHQTQIALLPWGGDLYEMKFTCDQVKERLICAAADVGLTLEKEDIVIATPSEFFSALREKASLLPVKSCDLNPPKYRQDLRGTYITRIGLKLKNRAAEQALLAWESLSACAGRTLPEHEELWKNVLFGQFHDTIGGSCVDDAYEDAMKRNDQVIHTVEERIGTMLGQSEGRVLNVYNPTSLVRSEIVSITSDTPCKVRTANGEELHSQWNEKTKMLSVHLPQIGVFEVVSLFAEPCQQEKYEPTPCMETEYYRIHLEPVTGDLDSIFDKTLGKELLCGKGNVIEAKQEQDPDMEGGLRLTGRVWRDEGIPAGSISMEETPLEITVCVVKPFLGFMLEKRIVLQKQKKQIDFLTRILDYPGDDLILCAEFSMLADCSTSIYETPFAVERKREGLYCAQKWAGLTDGSTTAALINYGTCGYWVQDNRLSLCLLRGHRNFEEYAKYGTQRGIARFEDGKSHTELAAECGEHRFAYSFVSASEPVEHFSALALCCNSPLRAVWSKEPSSLRSPIKVVRMPFVVTALLPMEGGICLRGYNASQKYVQSELVLQSRPKSVKKVNLLQEEQENLTFCEDTVTLSLRPFEIVTLQIKL